MKRLIDCIYRFRVGIWLAVVLLTTVLLLWNPQLQFQQSVESFFPKDSATLQAYQNAVAIFGPDDIIFVAYDDPELWTPAGMRRVRQLADSINESVPGVERVEALDQMPVPWKADAAVGALLSNPFHVAALLAGLTSVAKEVASLADQPHQLAELRQRAGNHPLFNNFFINRSGTMTAVVVRLEPARADRGETVRRLREIADDFAARNALGQVAVVGPPVLVTDGFASLERDNRTLVLVAMALMAVTMLLSVRSPWWAVLPLLAGWVTWLVTKAFLASFNLQLTLSSGPIVAQTVVLCMPAASHLAIRFRQALREEANPQQATRQCLLQTFAPVAWCSITAACGYLATAAATTVVPVAQMGVTMFVCNLLAGFLTFALAAGIMAAHRRSPQPTASRSEQQLGGLIAWVISHPVATLLLFAAPCVVVAFGLAQLQLESNFIKVYRPTTRVARDYRFVEDRMGGIGLVEVVFPAPAQVTPQWLAHVRATATRIQNSDPRLVGGVICVADLLEPPPTIQPNAPLAERILETKMRLLSHPANAHLIDGLWNRNQQMTRLLVRIRESAESADKERFCGQLQTLAKTELSPASYVTGLSYLMTQITSAVIGTMWCSTLWSCAMILLMLGLALRSVPLAVLAFTPTLLACLCVLGVMGWVGLRIDMSTAIVASVAIGLAVDDSFHCLLSWKEALKDGHTAREALQVSYQGAGPGVVLSSSAVSIGFLALLFSEFTPTANFGWLIAIATLGASIGNLIFVPACLALFSRSPTRPQPNQLFGPAAWAMSRFQRPGV